MAGRAHRRPVHPGTGSPSDPPGPADGKRRLARKDIPGPAGWLLETGNNQTRLVRRIVCRPYSDSEESDNDVLYAE